MQDKGEMKILLRYVINAMTNRKLTPKVLGELCDWVEESPELIGLDPLNPKCIAMIEGLREIRDADNNEVAAIHTAYLEKYLAHYEKNLQRLERKEDSQLTKNLKALQSRMQLEVEEQEVLGFLTRYHHVRSVEDFCDSISRNSGKSEFIISLMTAVPHDKVCRIMQKKGRLFKFGLLKVSGRSSMNFISDIQVNDQVIEALYRANGTIEDFRQCALGEPSTASLGWDDFEHLKPTSDKLSAFLKKVIDKNLEGVNILLHGPPGTGKTEFAKTIASHLGLTLYSVGEEDEDGDEPTRRERLASLRLAQTLLQDQDDCLVLFDEMDDLFESSIFSFLGRRSEGSKVFGNRLMENNPVPTIWTINEPGLLDPSVLRRMSFAIEIKNPPQKARQKVWAGLLDKHGVVVEQDELDELAGQEEVSPAIAENSIRFASLTGGNAEDIRFAAEGIIQVMSGDKKRIPKSEPENDFLVELVNADMELIHLTERLASTDIRSYSLCLNGPSGTGKSAYGRHLAKMLGMDVLYKRASDILDMYVGNSEKNIALMFQQAREDGKLLILDEADSLLSERSGAQRSWEVSQVNEMLTWMERHPLPFICTTNLMDALDQASMRRFTFKVCFDYLSEDQVEMGFRHFFNIECPANAGILSYLTPGDFATVQRKAKLLGLLNDSVQLVEMLAMEQQVKSIMKSKIGF